MGLEDKAVLVRLSISMYTARKYDKKASVEVAEAHGAVLDAGRFNKLLVDKKEINKMQKVVSLARLYHYTNTLPWLDTEQRILPSLNYFEYVSAMEKFKDEYMRVTDEFCDNWDDLVAKRKAELNTLGHDGDYRSRREIQSKFGFVYTFSPVPVSGDFRVGLREDEVQRIKDELDKQHLEAEQIMLKNLWDRVYENVRHMVNKLSDVDAIFHKTLVSNLVDLTGLLTKLNVMNDPKLESMRLEIENNLCINTAEDLRKDNDLRVATAKKAQEILDKMQGYV